MTASRSLRHRLTGPIIQAAVALAERIIPRRKGLVVIAGGGTSYDGNPRALMEAYRDRDDLQVMWYSKQWRLHREMRRRFGREAIPPRGPRTLWHMMRAQAFLMSHKLTSIEPYGRYRERCSIVYLTHGVPMKTMALGPHHPRRNHPIHKARFTHAIACSAFDQDLWARQYEMDPERIWITGYPRHAAMLRSPEREQPKQGPTLLYAPTYRQRGAVGGLERLPGADSAGLDALESILARHGATLWVRPHYFEVPGTDHSDRPHIRSSSGGDVNDILGDVDLLITDYSSIYIDFLLLDRPMVFAPYDKEQYLAGRGIQFDYDDHTPGAHVMDLPGLTKAIDAALSGEDAHAEERQRLRSIFHAHGDRGAADRIAEHLFRDAGVQRL